MMYLVNKIWFLNIFFVNSQPLIVIIRYHIFGNFLVTLTTSGSLAVSNYAQNLQNVNLNNASLKFKLPPLTDLLIIIQSITYWDCYVSLASLSPQRPLLNLKYFRNCLNIFSQSHMQILSTCQSRKSWEKKQIWSPVRRWNLWVSDVLWVKFAIF